MVNLTEDKWLGRRVHSLFCWKCGIIKQIKLTKEVEINCPICSTEMTLCISELDKGDLSIFK